MRPNRQSRSARVNPVPEKRGVVFRTKGLDPQCAFRIPLPHMGARRTLPLCGISGYGLPNPQKEGFFMSLYSQPFASGYWREALGSFRSLRSLTFSAVMIAACIVLSHFYIPLHESLTLSVTFLARALCSLVCGPLVAMVFAVAEDTLSFFLSSGGYPYFPGYALTTLLGCMTYALFFYRARITWRRIILAKTLTNIQNIFLGSLWSAMLYSKGYLYYLSTSAVKNLVYLPLQILMLGLMLRYVLPALRRQGLVPQQLSDGRIPL